MKGIRTAGGAGRNPPGLGARATPVPVTGGESGNGGRPIAALLQPKPCPGSLTPAGSPG
jgi:hypothetical protein